VLVTKIDGGVPVSSSSQPSLMAEMLQALDVRPGMRVLEIGAGTGYNAALLAALGAEVVSVDVQPDVAERAAAALDRAGVRGVTVRAGDGYEGASGEHVDRVIVTVGVAGVSPHWLAQVRGGPIVAPVRHAGTNPVFVVRAGDDGEPRATPVCPAGFMTAAGPLAAHHPWAHPDPAGVGELASLEPAGSPRWDPPLSPARYRDLWFAAGVWHRRATFAAVPGSLQGLFVLLDEVRSGGSVVEPDGTVLAGGSEAARYAGEAVALLDRWEAAGRPRLTAWRGELSLAGQPSAPIWVPYDWVPAHQTPARRSRQDRPSGS
jgi:protein-L-isoaspartate(D-aspartate) O-methyltransferase